MGFVDTVAGRLHYRFDGAEGAPVLLLSNALGTDLGVWDGQIAALARHFRVLRYDTRGHGAAPVTAGPYSVDLLGADVLALLDALGVARVHFCGLSMGGVIGLWLAVHAPERIERLVLANTGARLGGTEVWNPRIAAVRQGGMAAVIDGVIDRWFTSEFRQAAPAQVAAVRSMVLRCPAEGYAAACGMLAAADLRAEASRVTCPTLLLTGRADAATPPEASRFLVETIPGARTVELPASHLAVIEAAQAFRDAVLAFLTEG